jgi:hypothetical protein
MHHPLLLADLTYQQSSTSVSVFWLQRRLIAKGLGGAFLKTLSIYFGRRVVGYLEFERIRVTVRSSLIASVAAKVVDWDNAPDGPFPTAS